MKQTLLILFLFSTFLYGQEINGIVTDDEGITLVGVLVEGSHYEKTTSYLDGNFTLKAKSFPIKLTFKLFDFKFKTIALDAPPKSPLKIVMTPLTQEVEGIVVSASRRKQKIEEIPVSL